jgi:hypothetical protein
MSAFMVDMHALESKGVETSGLYCAPREVYLTMKLPNSLVGHKGWIQICMFMLDNTRLSSAARAVGYQILSEHAVHYAKVVGQPIATFR